MSLRGRAVAYLVVLHLIFAGARRLSASRTTRSGCSPSKRVFALSLAVGRAARRASMYRQLGLAAEGLRLIRDEEFTSRFLPVGQPEIDELIGVYNRMVDHLRDGARAARRAASVPEPGARRSRRRASSSSTSISASAASTRRPSGCSDRAGATVVGRRLDALGSPLGDALAALAPGDARVVGLLGARRVKCHHGTFVDRGFPRSFLLIEELTEELRQFERAAYEKLIRVMSHEVNNTVAASNSLLHSSLTYAGELDAANRHDFEQAHRHRDRAHRAAEQLHAAVRGRVPPAARRCGSRDDLVAVLEGIVAAARARRPDAAGIDVALGARRAVGGWRSIAARWSRRCSTSSRTRSRRSTAHGHDHGAGDVEPRAARR